MIHEAFGVYSPDLLGSDDEEEEDDMWRPALPRLRTLTIRSVSNVFCNSVLATARARAPRRSDSDASPRDAGRRDALSAGRGREGGA